MNTEIRDTEERTAEQFLSELFEYEYCAECGLDAEDHTAVPLAFGAYSNRVIFFARCDHAEPDC